VKSSMRSYLDFEKPVAELEAKADELRSVAESSGSPALAKEIEALEEFRFAVLCQFAVGEEITKEKLREVLAKPITVPAPVQELHRQTLARFVAAKGSTPSAEERRRIEASVYAVYSVI